jgi:hypothetical protein
MATKESAALSGAASGAAIGTGVLPGWGTAIGAAVGGIGGLLAGAAAEKDSKKQKEILQEGINRILSIPNPEERIAVYASLKQQGLLTPEAETAIKAQDSELRNISTDPRVEQAQMAALSQLQELGKSGGLDQADRVNIEAARQRAAAESARQQEAVQESMARRGVSGSGLEMAQRQMAAQAASNQSSMAEQQIQGEARRRALDAMVKSGAMAGDIRSQSFTEEARKADAQDLINRFNATAAQGVMQRNVGTRNAAQASNLETSQSISDKNAAIRNAQMDVERTAPGRQFDRELAKASSASGQGGALANYYGAQAQGTRDMWGNILGSGGKIASAYASRPQPITTSSPTQVEPTNAWEDQFDPKFRMQGVD